MNISDLLKEAYEKKDWAIVNIVYGNLTGDNLEDNEGTFQPKSKLVLPNRQPQPQAKQQAKAAKEIPIPVGSKGRPARTEQVDTSKNGINIFVDDGTEAVEDKAIDAKLKSKVFVPRNRPPDESNIPCNTCGNVYCVSNSLITAKGFVCNNCLIKRR